MYFLFYAQMYFLFYAIRNFLVKTYLNLCKFAFL